MTFRRLFIGFVLALLAAGCSEPPSFVPAGNTADLPGVTRPQSENVKELVDGAMKVAQGGDLAASSTLLEKALRLEPENRAALRLLAAIDLDWGTDLKFPKAAPRFFRAGELARKLARRYPKLSEPERLVHRLALYNEGRAYCYEGETEKALASLNEAVDAGFVKLETLRNDKELAPLRNDVRFRQLTKKVETKANEVARKQALELLAENSPFKFDFKLPSVDGKTVSLADFRGKAVIVDLWATWCGPCRREIPDLIEIFNRKRDKGLQVVGINYEGETDQKVTAAVRDFVKEFEINYPTLIGDEETKDLVPDFRGLPTTLFIDRKGQVRARLNGYGPDTAMIVESVVDLLLDETGSAPASSLK